MRTKRGSFVAVFSLLCTITSNLAAPASHATRRWSNMLTDIPGMRMGFAADKTTLTKRFYPHWRRWSQILGQISGNRMGFAAESSTLTIRSLRVDDLSENPWEFLVRKMASTWRGYFRPDDLATIYKERVSKTPVHVDLNTFHLQYSKTILPLFKVAGDMSSYDDLSISSLADPWLYFECHMNNAHRRHSQFSQVPVDEEHLSQRFRKRAESLGYDLRARHDSSSSKLTKRDFYLHRKRNANLTLSLVAGQNATSLATSSGASAGQSQNASNQSTTPPGAASSSNSNSQGFSPKALEALKTKAIIPPETPTAANSLGFSIEANDVGYFAEIKVGTPPQNFKVIVDSGSSDFWLSGPQCSNSATGAPTCAHQSLSPQSTSLKTSTSNFKVTYGTGNVAGVLVQENVDVAGLILQGHTFGGATAESNEFAAADVPFDGLMGTAKSALSNQGVLTPIETLAKTKTVAGAFMGYALGRASDGKNIGQVTFGGVDQTRFDGALTLFDNVSKVGFWEGTMTQATVDGKAVVTGKTAILDTGTTLMLIPPADATAIHAAIPGAKTDGQGGFTVPCATQASVALNLGGKEFKIQPSDLAFQPLSANQLDGDCISGISAGNVGGDDQWLVGDVFLKNVYFATDATNNQIGLAAVKAAT